MSLYEVPMPPAGPKPEGRSIKFALSTMSPGEDNAVLRSLREKSSVMDRSQPLPTTLQSDFIPEEIISALTSTANAATRSELLQPPKKNKSLKDMKAGLRIADPLWHHPGRRGRFKHLTEQPICLTGAGRDISFLCDALMVTEKSARVAAGAGTQQDGEHGTEKGIEDSLIPQEFHVIKSRGVLGLEYYEDKYTTLLEDPEQRLMAFPSMKPNGRAEVLQLMKVMDAMLEKVGVDSEDLGEAGPTQMHNLLDLLKAEQNIYNTVFHELIRQVSVECVERGELLSKIRKRYVNLLDKIPRQVQSLHNDMIAQRALDRRLTENVVHFKNSVGELIRDLSQVREHDLRVSRDADYAKEELAVALEESKRNNNTLKEFRELYELQRQRLEAQVIHLTEERDLWSSATYNLARKVIEENRLHLAHRLYLSEKAWTKLTRHFTVVVASKDTMNLSQIQQATERWRGIMVRFGQELERAEESSREKLHLLKSDLEKWQLYFQDKVFENKSFQGVPDSVMETVLQDLLKWEKMMTEDLERFGGDVLLTNQERLKLAEEIQQQWTQLGQKVLKRHCSLDGDLPPEYRAMEDLNQHVLGLSQQYTHRVDGENGVGKLLTTLVSSLEFWSYQLQVIRNGPHGMQESEWRTFYSALQAWLEQMDRTLKLLGTIQSEESTGEGTRHEHVAQSDVFKMLQQWNAAMTSGAEKDDIHLTQQVTSIHTAMVRWMVNLLIVLAPNFPSIDTSLPPKVMGTLDEEITVPGTSVKELVEDAKSLSHKLRRFTEYMVSACQETMDMISQATGDAFEADHNYEMEQLETIKIQCNEWIETCQLLLSEIGGLPVAQKSESQDTLKSIEFDTDDKTIPRSPSPLRAQGPLSELTHLMNIIGHDANIKQMPLQGEEVLVYQEGTMLANRPHTPKSQLAFDSLGSLEQLNKQLLQSELRAQKAEETSETLDEQLRNALEKIQELESQLTTEKKYDDALLSPEGKPLEDKSARGDTLSARPVTSPRPRRRTKPDKGKH